MNPMPDRLSALVMRQHELQEHLGELPTVDDSNAERLVYLRTSVLACIAELYEALDETGWKPWTTSNHINSQPAFAELCDALQFLLNAMFAVCGPSMDPATIAHLIYTTHSKKVGINKARAALPEGYDGVAGKCPVCKRAYDDPAVKCGPGVHVVEVERVA
jgi:dUTPase